MHRIVQAAGGVEHWLSSPTEVLLSVDGNIEIWKATDTIPITVERKRFMRVKVVVP